MKNAYKPIILFINEKRERILRYHTKYFDQYDPHSKLCETDAKVEFLKNDGSYDRVYVETNGNKKKGLTKPMDITSTKYKFTYQKRQMEIKFDLECLIQVNTHHQGRGQIEKKGENSHAILTHFTLFCTPSE